MTSRSALALAVVTLLGAAVYMNALHNPFVYDDYHTVVANPSLAHPGNVRAVVLYAVTRPAVNASYAVDRAVFGPGPFGFHVTNLLLHALNVALLFELAWLVSGATTTAFIAAALFAVHPMMSEAVGYISGRSELLCGTFFLLALLCGWRWIRGGGRRWAASVVALWFAALASKETAAAFPFVLLALDRLGGGAHQNADRASVARDRHRRLVTVHVPLVGVALAGGVVRLFVLAREYPDLAPRWSYLLLDLDVVRRYLWLLVFPSGQTIFHAVPPANLGRGALALTVLSALVLVMWLARRTAWPASLGLLWFVLLLAPAGVLTLLGQGEPMAEHRVYLASCGLFLAAGDAVGRVIAPLLGASSRGIRWLAAGVLALVVAALGAETWIRNIVWADPIALWRESVDLAPAHYRARLLLGEALVQEARWAEARRQFAKALEIDAQDEPARRALAALDRMERGFGINVERR